jgi:tetratricopeptide (TPR) repeat protein
MSEFQPKPKPKPIHGDAVKAALEKALWYRALNEPLEADSICRDVLAVDPDNQEAIATLLLALTDQFGSGLPGKVREARELAARLRSEYERDYYNGIICERRAKSQYQQGIPGCGHIAYEGFREAMAHYEKAEKIRPRDNDDAILRWNACARFIVSHADIVPAPAAAREAVELE